MGIKDNILGTFRQQDNLSPDIWVKYDNVDEFLMQEDVKEQLIEIANKFIEFIDIDADTCEIDTRDCDIIDMVVTGSIANYNWSKFWAITRPNKVEFIAALPRNATSFKPKKTQPKLGFLSNYLKLSNVKH